MKPSDAELKTIAERYARAYGSEESRTVVWLAKAELQRRAAHASVPAELVEQWYAAADAKRPRASDAEVLADVCAQAAAYGREQAQWVPVSERLPKDGKTVIFWIRPAGYASVGKLDIDSRCFHSVGGWVNQDDVSHWMPLPEPPTC